MGVVEDVATTSLNLKGTYQKALKDVAMQVRLGMSVLTEREGHRETEELAELRAEVKVLREQIRELRARASESQHPWGGERGGDGTGVPGPGAGSLLPKPDAETTKSNGYSAAVKRSIQQQQQQAPETEKNKISKVKKNGGRTGKDGARDEVAERLLEQLENLRRMMKCDKEWTVVQSRGAGRNKERKESRVGEKRTPKVITKAPLITEAVVITCEDKESGGMELIRRAKRNISLEGLGIAEARTRKTATGATLIQITGEGRKDKADALAGKLKEFFGEARVKVNRPVKRTELRLRGLEEGTMIEEVKSVVARIGEGSEEEVRVGRIAWNRMGYGSVLVTCTAEMARRLMEKEERIRIGWARIYVERIPPRALQCYRCLENGHTGVTCDNSVDRSGHWTQGEGLPNSNTVQCMPVDGH
ncbi:hypothetical protein X777_04575 [Ooceraea biroi]|uniref:CCHC-type domain-containing protein n=1 Tax=Ooceraea biroi TaxID=2015173 RepID=A0A026X4B1_OOCBI|nr:hypothetical protein X777_04575 [Ooceraea biroi]